MERSTGIVLLVGSLVFLAGVMFPVVQEVFGAMDDPGAMASAIAGNESAWTAANVLFAVGALVAAGGLWGLGRGSMIGTIAGVAAVAGALVYAGFTALGRITDSPEDIAAAISGDADWTALVYSLLTSIALIGVGYVILQSGTRRWLGWVFLAFGVGTLVGYFAMGDMPPGVYYAATLIAGIALVFSREPAPQTA